MAKSNGKSRKSTPPAAPQNRRNRSEPRPPPKREGAKVSRTPAGQFPKGVSGNPGGRPAEYVDFVKLAREKGSPRAFRTLLRMMRRGDDRAAVQAALGMLAYAWGKPKVAVELSGPNGGPVETSDARAKLAQLLLGRLDEMDRRQAAKEA